MKEERKLNLKFIIIAIISISIFVIAIVPKELQNDTFYTIKLGKLILDNGIDMQEHFAWHNDMPYTYPHWLYDVCIYLIFSIGGYHGLYISTIIFGIILGISIYLTNVKLTKNTIFPFFTTIFVLFVGKDFIAARAQLITFILFVLTIYCIECFLETKKKRYIIYLFLIPTLIANIHAAVFPFYFILYLPYIGEYIYSLLFKDRNLIIKFLIRTDEIEIINLKYKKNKKEKHLEKLEILNKRIEENKQRLQNELENKESYKIIVNKNDNCKWLIIIMLIAILTGFLTLIGDTPYTYLYKTMIGNTTENISEHLPIVLYNSIEILLIISVEIILIALTKIKIKLSDLFLFAGLVFLTIMSRRQQSMLLFVGIIVINRTFVQLIKIYDEKNIEGILKFLTSITAKIIIFTLFISYTIFQINKTKDVEYVSNETYPIEATKYIKENLDLNSIKLFNEYNFGSYLLLNDIPVFIDSRADVYDPKFNGFDDDIFKDFIKIIGLNCDYEERFEHYGITHIITYKDSSLDKILNKDELYNELYKDKKFVIYERLTANK